MKFPFVYKALCTGITGEHPVEVCSHLVFWLYFDFYVICFFYFPDYACKSCCDRVQNHILQYIGIFYCQQVARYVVG
uniref:Uncharacterized protein n=1 Tax=Rhizophora mucronata TaxID=61149 RepID=A0A2P2L326_RHIMU